SEDLVEGLDGTGEPGAAAGDDERALDQDRVLDHRGEDLLVARLGEPQLAIQRLALAHGPGGGEPGRREQLAQLLGGPTIVEVPHDGRLDPGLPQAVEGLARGRAARVVIDRRVHGVHGTAPRSDHQTRGRTRTDPPAVTPSDGTTATTSASARPRSM